MFVWLTHYLLVTKTLACGVYSDFNLDLLVFWSVVSGGCSFQNGWTFWSGSLLSIGFAYSTCCAFSSGFAALTCSAFSNGCADLIWSAFSSGCADQICFAFSSGCVTSPPFCSSCFFPSYGTAIANGCAYPNGVAFCVGDANAILSASCFRTQMRRKSFRWRRRRI